MIRVTAVHEDSLGSTLGLGPGTELLAVNGRELRDFLDWEFWTADDRFVLLARSPAGELVEYDIERPDSLPMGVELESPSIRRCANRCDFCFVDGLPGGLREPLYVRDDDYRLSFRYGNFATLTNLKRPDIDRIVEYRLSPLYVSVHATDPMVRRRLLRNPRAPDIVAQLRMFAEHGIRFHTQIVLQPGVNDGAVLERSLEDLFALGDPVLSVSVVPVGLTEYSKHHLVRQPSAAECRAAVATVDRYAHRAVAKRGTHWAYGADELYMVAELPLPQVDRYDEFEQVENGVGAVRYLQRRIAQARNALPDLRGMHVAILTGAAMGPLMPHVIDTLAEATRATFELLAIENDLFGRSVTSAGLLPGSAFRRALEDRVDLDLALLPAEALNAHGRFLDDLEFVQLVESVPMEIRPSHDFADAFVESVTV
jgi:putative radical SAM enzyme (TIGR03279 family)